MTFTVRAILHWGAPSGISESRMLVSSTTETNMQWLILSDFSLKKLTTARPHALNQLNSNRKRLNLIFTVPGLFMSESGVISFRKLSAGCSQVFMSTCLACFLNVLALIELSLAFSVCCLRFTTACNSASSSLFDELSDSDSLMGLSGSLLDAELSSPAALAGTLSLASGTSCPCHKRLNDMAIKHKICFGSVSLCNGEAHFLRPLIFNGRFKLNVESTVYSKNVSFLTMKTCLSKPNPACMNLSMLVSGFCEKQLQTRKIKETFQKYCTVPPKKRMWLCLRSQNWKFRVTHDNESSNLALKGNN